MPHRRPCRPALLIAWLALGAPASAQFVRTFSAEVEGGLVTAACGLRGAGPPEAIGGLDVAGIPPGATILHASLNWVILSDLAADPNIRFGLAGGPLAAYVGEPIGDDVSPCWPEHERAWAYRLDVCEVLAANGNASYEVAVPDSGNLSVEPSAEGITLFVVWQAPGSPQRDIVIYEGARTVLGMAEVVQVLDGFDASAPVRFAEVTFVVADTQSGLDARGLAFVNGVSVSDEFDSDDAADCVSITGRFYDTDSYDASALVAPGDTQLEASLVHYGDCFTWTGVAAEISTDTVAPPSAACSPPNCDALRALAEDVLACEGELVMLDGSASVPCAGEGLGYAWFDGAVELCPPSRDPTCPWVAATGADLRLEVLCDVSLTCTDSVAPPVTVEQPPLLRPATAEDLTRCGDGVRLRWSPAAFRGAGGTGRYNVYRSELDCADAVTRPPIASGLRVDFYTDPTTMAGATYFYVIEAEDDAPALACTPVGPGGGAVARACVMVSVRDVPTDPDPPEGVFATLRARHDSGLLTLHWETARALLADEVYWILQVEDDPTRAWGAATLDDPLGVEHVERELSAPLQFFDLRVLDDCGRLSEDEFPPG